ncbi:MAG: zinc metallopeptidase [Mycoplasmatales bacterium]|nr:zinc metallopeptidase [Mycoplasmatales bacterium]
MNNFEINGYKLSDSEQIIAIIIIILSALVFVLSIGLFSMWIYYSWIKRVNSQNYTGADLTKYIFDKTNTDVQIKNSWFYVKYWNYNKRKNTYRLRPWTYSRKSIWTMMEASQQAYVTTIRKEKGKQFWLIFRLPLLFRIIGGIGGISLIFLAIHDSNNLNDWDFGHWLLVIMGISIIFIGYTIADVGRVYVLWKNVLPVIKDSGLSNEELAAIKRIFFWRMIYSIVVVILEILKLIFRIAINSNKSSK